MSDKPIDPEDQRTADDPSPPQYDSAVVDRARLALNDIAATPSSVAEAVAGAMIGKRYKLLEPIGEGGMGLVWMAEQRSPIRRLVAVKLIKAGMDSAAVLARFEAERQALAMMDHPSIARIFDGGTTDRGHPFFVMELVKGLPLTRYCDERKLSVEQRLELFIQVCGAVQHAHQKGIIHRDLKPGNLLVTEHDGKPVPKVIDFGLVKALGGSSVLTEHTLHTAYGAVAGTPHYMAPEQVAINALDVDTRTDIYALGVILYELLAGSTPHELKQLNQAAWDEVRRVIREVDPPRPSLRVTQSKTLNNLAVTRHTEPARLGRLISGDLDWIVMKALEKDRHRRYGTASDLAADVHRHLAGEAVLAAPPTAAYRLTKFAHKYRVALTTASVILCILIAGIAVSTWQAIRARGAEAVANTKTIDAQNEKNEAEHQRQTAVEASKRAEAEAATVQRQLADSYIQNGLAADVPVGALWYLKALKLDQDDPHRQLMDRIRIGDAFRECAMPTYRDEPAAELPSDAPLIGRPCDFRLQPDGGILIVDSATRFKPVFPVSRVYRTDNLLLMCNDHTVQIFDENALKALSPPIAAENVNGFETTQDHRFLAASAPNKVNKKEFRIWNTTTGNSVQFERNSVFDSIAFSPNGKLAAVVFGKTASVWSLDSTIRQGGSIPAPLLAWPVYRLNDLGILVLANGASSIDIYDSKDGSQIGNWFNVKGEFFRISPSGDRVLSKLNSDHFTLYDTIDGAELFTIACPSFQPSPRFSADGKWLQSGHLYWNARITESPDSMLRVAGPQQARNLKFSPDGKRVATYGDALRLWDVATLQPVSPPPFPEVVDLAFAKHTNQPFAILVNHKQWCLGAIDAHTGYITHVGPQMLPTGPVMPLAIEAISADGNYILLSTSGEKQRRTLTVFAGSTLQPLINLRLFNDDAPGEQIESLAFTPDEKAVVGRSESGALIAWDTVKGDPIQNPSPSWKRLVVPGVSFPDEKSYLLTKGEFRVLRTEDEHPLSPAFPASPIARSDPSFSLGMQGEIVVGSQDNLFALFDARSAMQITDWFTCDNRAQCVGVSVDGRSALSYSSHNSASFNLRKWNTSACTLEIAEAEAVAQILSSREIDELGGLVRASPKRYAAALEVLRKSQDASPYLFTPTRLPPAAQVLDSYRDQIDSRIAQAVTPQKRTQLADELAETGREENSRHQFTEAIFIEQKALSLDGSNLAAKEHLAYAYVGERRYADALAIYKQIEGQSYKNAVGGNQLVAFELWAEPAIDWSEGDNNPTFKQVMAIASAAHDRDQAIHSSDTTHPTTLPSDTIQPTTLPADSPQPTTLPTDTSQPTTQPTDEQISPADLAARYADDAIAFFNKGKPIDASESLRKAYRIAHAYLKFNPTLSAKLRSARSLIDPPSTQPADYFARRLADSAWAQVSVEGRSAEIYRIALETALQAVTVEPSSFNLHVLGAAQYRAGLHQDALDTLRRSDETDSIIRDNQLWNLVVSAMARFRLGQPEQAVQLLIQARHLAKEPNSIDDTQKAWLSEAADLIKLPVTRPST